MRRVGDRVTSAPVLGLAFTVVTLLATGPLQQLDRALNQPWSRWVLEGWRPFLVQVVDRITSREIAMPVLGVVALVLVWRWGKWRPVLLSVAAVAADKALVAVLKLFFARASPVIGGPGFFDGGLFQYGMEGVIYPSGHAADAVLIYGLVAYLVARYGQATRRVITLLGWGVAVITLVAVATSLYLGFHWATDLIAGVLIGGLVLRVTIAADHAGDRRTRPRSRGDTSGPTPHVHLPAKESPGERVTLCRESAYEAVGTEAAAARLHDGEEGASGSGSVNRRQFDLA